MVNNVEYVFRLMGQRLRAAATRASGDLKPELERMADEFIDLAEAAQGLETTSPDGSFDENVKGFRQKYGHILNAAYEKPNDEIGP